MTVLLAHDAVSKRDCEAVLGVVGECAKWSHILRREQPDSELHLSK